MPDIGSLNALVHASPFYHQSYLANRKSILSTVISREANPQAQVDAVAALRSLDLGTGKGHFHKFKEFLAQYRIDRDRETSLYQSLPCAEIIQLGRLHTVIQFLTIDFCRSSLEARPCLTENRNSDAPLSVNETRRIRRAFV